MADPTSGGGSGSPIDPQTIKQLQSLNTQMQQSSEYSKQMLTAINSMAKPMEHMSDLTKAIQQSFTDFNKSSKELAESFNKLEGNTDKTRSHSKDIVDNFAEMLATSGDINDFGEEYVDVMREILDKGVEIKKVQQENTAYYAKQTADARHHQEALKEQVGIWGSLKAAVSEYHDKAANASGLYAKGGATFAELGFGKSNMQEAVKNIGSSLSMLIPSAAGIGGLLGLMISGRVEDAKFEAIGQTAALAFNKMGGFAHGFASKLGNAQRELSAAAMASEGDIAVVAEAFASTGITAKEASEHVKGFNSIVGKDLIYAALGADKALQLPAGSIAKLTGVLSGNFGDSALKAYSQLIDIGSAAKDAGINMTTFMAQTMEASSALRMLHANGATAAAQLSLGMYGSMGGGHGDQGLNRYAQGYAAQGTQSAVQSIAGLNVGMSAVIGQRLGMGSGLDAWYQMKGGDPREQHRQALDITRISQELGKLAMEHGRTRAEQVYFLQQTTGADKAGAETMLESTNLKPGQVMSKSAQSMVNDGFKSESMKTSQIMKDISEIKDGILHVGNGLLGLIVSGLKLVYDAIRYGFSMPGTKEHDYYSRAMSMDLSIGSKSADEMMGGLKKIGRNSENLFKYIFQTDRYTSAPDDNEPNAPINPSLHPEKMDFDYPASSQGAKVHKVKVHAKPGAHTTTITTTVHHGPHDGASFGGGEHR
jgi:hypothetical protein